MLGAGVAAGPGVEAAGTGVFCGGVIRGGGTRLERFGCAGVCGESLAPGPVAGTVGVACGTRGIAFGRRTGGFAGAFGGTEAAGLASDALGAGLKDGAVRR